MNPPRKIFTVLIHETEYDIYDVDKKEHMGYNDTPKTWWLYNSSRLPEGSVPPPDSEYFVPYHRSIERHLWDIRIKQRNTTKEKWGETQYRNSTWVDVYCNNKLFFAFPTIGGERGIAFAMAKVQYLQTMMSEHPYDFFHPETEEGRKIWWYGLPATCHPRVSMGWEIIIKPDYTTGISKEEWWKELARREEKVGKKPDSDFDEINKGQQREWLVNEQINWGDAFADQHIDWFRK